MRIVRRTRFKFIIVMAVIVAAMIVSLCLVTIASTRSNLSDAADELLSDMIKYMETTQDGNHESSGSRFTDSRGFVAKINRFNEVIDVAYNTNTYSEQRINALVKEILALKQEKGNFANNRFSVVYKGSEKILACVDMTEENSIISSLINTLILAGVGVILFLLISLWFLSSWVIEPTAEAFNKQKRFISEGGHELKTPLTVISAAVELMQKDPKSPNNKKLLKSVQEQTEKMAMMVAGLLSISRMDEDAKGNIRKRFDLSQTVLTEALAFESVAFENGRRMECHIEENLFYKGDVQAVRQAMGILCDNAIKHSISRGIIRVQLQKQGKNFVLTVSNASRTIKREELPFLFERFFRGSESRTETKGAGLGLSILKSLAEENGWKVEPIHAKQKMIFQIVL